MGMANNCPGCPSHSWSQDRFSPTKQELQREGGDRFRERSSKKIR